MGKRRWLQTGLVAVILIFFLFPLLPSFVNIPLLTAPKAAALPEIPGFAGPGLAMGLVFASNLFWKFFGRK